MKELTRSISDGLVKQDNAYVVTGSPPAPGDRYPENRTCFYANVHRAHSGNRGIFNTLASYENIQRFLFGDTRAELSLENIDTNRTHVRTPFDSKGPAFHPRLLLHTAFLNSRLRNEGDKFSHFGGKVRVVEHGSRMDSSGIMNIPSGRSNSEVVTSMRRE